MPEQPTPVELSFVSGGVEVGLDVYLPTQSSPIKRAPILVWWHGGGLLQGYRKSIWKHLLDAPDKHGLAVISADYRLAPQVKMGAIMDDIRLTIDFVRQKLPKDVAERVDTSKIVVSGGSAGGWLALLAGTGIVSPPPQVVAAIYPITIPGTDPFFATPMKPHPPFLDKPLEHADFAEFLDEKAQVVSWNDPKSLRQKIYFYMQQEGILTKLLFEGSGLDPQDYDIVTRLGKLDKTQMPPTYIVHGDDDVNVGTDHSRVVADKLKSMGATYQYDELKGKPHLYDRDPSETMDAMYSFIKAHL